jgi:hypothetical protein
VIETQDDGRVTITIAADEPWNDAFWAPLDGTRPLAPDWTRIRLIIRPDYEHPTILRALSTDGVSPEITVVDANEAAFAIHVAQATVSSAFPRLSNRDTARYTHMLIAEYPDPNDNRELWRGNLFIKPGRLS